MSKTFTLEDMIAIALLTPRQDPSDPNCQWGQPLILWGSPGIGKTGRVESACRQAGLPLETLYAATRQPEDFSGVIVADGKGGACTVSLLGAINTLMEVPRGVLFLDELSCARPATQGAALSLVLEKRVGEKTLPPGIRILAAANPSDEAAGGWDLEPPMANRFAHVDVPKPSSSEWIEWMTTNGIPSAKKQRGNVLKDGEATIVEQWPSMWPRVKGYITGFLHSNSGLLHKLPVEGHKDRGRAWPSHRSWEMAARMATSASILYPARGSKEISTAAVKAVAACVGAAVASEFSTWVINADLPSPEEVLANGWVVDTHRLDRTLVVLGTVLSYVLSTKDTQEKENNAGKLWGLLKQMCDSQLKDLALGPARTLINNGMGLRLSTQFPAARSVITIFQAGTFAKDVLPELSR